MARQLEIIEHEGIQFYVDLKLDELRQVDKPYLNLSFDMIEDDNLLAKVVDILEADI